ncbi:hypothetical protein DVH05_020966 [Phytophthora capsici]|nr:hypothetical protein DVH05_020966 [Phytophthora capsici]
MGNVVGCFKTNKKDAEKAEMNREEVQDVVLHTKNEAQVETPIEPSRIDEKPEEEAYAEVNFK